MHYFEKGNELKRLYALMLAMRMTSFELFLRYKRYLLFLAGVLSSLALCYLYGWPIALPGLREEAVKFGELARSPRRSEDEELVRAFKLIQ